MNSTATEAEWKSLVANYQRRGMGTAAAVQAAITNYPVVHAQYLAECFATLEHGSTPAERWTHVASEWDAALLNLTAGGMATLEATAELARRHPALHAAYVQAFQEYHAFIAVSGS